VREFCARYGICKQTFYDEIHRGRITAKKLGKKTVILRTDADAWAKSLPALDPGRDCMSRCYFNQSRPAAGKENARRELRTRHRANGNRNDGRGTG
jgi:excisionase family DNA binding protein